MNFRNIFWGILLPTILLGCTNDDSLVTTDETSKTPDFMVVGEDIENIYQYNYKADILEGELINLTLENNIAVQYLELRQVDDLLTFYSFSSGNFSAVQRNAVTGINGSFDNFYTVSGERSILWGTNSANKLFLGYFSPQGSTNFGFRSIDLSTDQETDMNIAFNVNTVFQPLYSNGKLMLTYRDNLNINKVAVINTETNALVRTLDFGSDTPSIFIDDQGDLAIILAMDSANQIYQVYDFDTLDLIEERSLLLDRLFAPGPLEANFFDEKLFYINNYIQPSPIIAGPAVYDFVTSENKVIDMIKIAQDVERDLGENIVLSAIDYKTNSNSFLVGYGKQEGNVLEGGVLVISLEGGLINNVNLPFAPTYIVQ